ncbi:MAG: 3-hydroxyacyl-ACP dehydratase FabZ [Candidatus Dadabacteria bacterium]|nr:3-hydroxyacyl-ACP dehydratase FabZ [Candidatus Dadabacteria bacterium]
MSKDEIKRLLPHREPFLFVDGVLEMEPGERIVAFKVFHPEEEFFKGHFPGNPIVPGVIIVEALAQAGGILAYASEREGLKGKEPALVGLDNVKFRKFVLPGREIKLEVKVLKRRDRVWRMKGEAFDDGVKVAEGEILATLL